MLSRRLTVVVAATMLLALSAPTAQAAGGSCTGGQVSAIDQYCETIPSASGGQAPDSGSPTLASTLPPRTVRGLVREGGRAALLDLPAASPPIAPLRDASGRASHGAASGPPSVPGSAPTPAAASLALPLILILVAIATGLACIELVRRRRQHA